jgi:hypothetical protein
MAFQKGKSGNPNRLFRKGTSGNPGGRPKGFAAQIKELCGDDYRRIVEGLYLLAFGSPQAIAEFFEHPGLEVDAKIRLAALIELRDSGPGRPKAVVEIETPPDVPLFAITTAVSVQPLVPLTRRRGELAPPATPDASNDQPEET